MKLFRKSERQKEDSFVVLITLLHRKVKSSEGNIWWVVVFCPKFLEQKPLFLSKSDRAQQAEATSLNLKEIVILKPTFTELSSEKQISS